MTSEEDFFEMEVLSLNNILLRRNEEIKELRRVLQAIANGDYANPEKYAEIRLRCILELYGNTQT